MKRISFLLLAAALLGPVLTACSSDNVGAPLNGANFVAVQSILSSNWSACHGALSGRFFQVTMDSAELQQSGLVDPTNPAQSLYAW